VQGHRQFEGSHDAGTDGAIPLLLELARPVSFFLSLLSLYPVMMSAFFVPGTHWQERLWMALMRVVFSACVCFASGILYAMPENGPSREDSEAQASVFSTLPVQIFLWTMAAMILLFALSWYIEAYYVPMASRDCCRL
jgi:hypothetical protein